MAPAPSPRSNPTAPLLNSSVSQQGFCATYCCCQSDAIQDYDDFAPQMQLKLIQKIRKQTLLLVDRSNQGTYREKILKKEFLDFSGYNSS